MGMVHLQYVLWIPPADDCLRLGDHLLSPKNSLLRDQSDQWPPMFRDRDRRIRCFSYRRVLVPLVPSVQVRQFLGARTEGITAPTVRAFF